MSLRDKDQIRISSRRIRLTELGCIAVCLLFCGMFGWKYTIAPLVSSSSRATKNTIVYNAIKNYAIEGDYLDRSGTLIMGNASAGSPASASSPMNKSYAWLLGYYSVSSGRENRFGLRGNLADYSLFRLNRSNKGASVTLTTDNRLQNYAFKTILDSTEGSVTVIDNRTGAILCLASQSTITYDVNKVETLLESTVEGSQFRRGTFENDPPGSTFKVVTSAAAIKAALDNHYDEEWFSYNDNGVYVPENSDFTITNFNNKAYGELNLERALNNSVNCYFANLGNKVGEARLKEMAEAFMVGKDIEIPFLTTLHSGIDFGKGTPAEIAQIAFGQGSTQITPVHICLIAQAVANGGVMMQPYIVDSIYRGRYPLYAARQQILSKVLSSDVDTELKRIMHSTAEVYGLKEGSYGMVYAKTGTAECANDRIHIYIMGFTEDASFCISMNNRTNSHYLYDKAKQLVRKINEVYGRQ